MLSHLSWSELCHLSGVCRQCSLGGASVNYSEVIGDYYYLLILSAQKTTTVHGFVIPHPLITLSGHFFFCFCLFVTNSLPEDI